LIPHGKLLLNQFEYRTQKKYVRYYRDANDSLERQTQEALDQSHSKPTAAAPLAAPRLIDVIEQENNRGYGFVSSFESLFRTID
tara:strand:+ start:501 stop:752 length:252 start_codon:yes stop_codon:yes gene_type:complete